MTFSLRPWRLGAFALIIPVLAGGQGVTGPVRPGDRIEVVSSEVRETVGIAVGGRAVVPLVGPIALAGLSAREAEDSVSRALARLLARPDIRVTVLRRVIVDGAVNSAGVLFVDESVGLSAAIALAGGIAGDGDVRRIELWRDGAMVGRFTLESLDRAGVPPLASSDRVVVRRTPWVVRNAFSVASLVASFASTLAVLLTR